MIIPAELKPMDFYWIGPQENQFAEMSRQLETFREKLEVFAAEHKQEIRKDPAFRKHFQVTYLRSQPTAKVCNINQSLSNSRKSPESPSQLSSLITT